MVTRSPSSSLYLRSSSSFGSRAPRNTRCIIRTNSSYLSSKVNAIRLVLSYARKIVVVDGDPADVLAQGGLDDQLARQVELIETPLHLWKRSQTVSAILWISSNFHSQYLLNWMKLYTSWMGNSRIMECWPQIRNATGTSWPQDVIMINKTTLESISQINPICQWISHIPATF